MNSSEPIGGYFELELKGGNDFLHHDAILLNSARNSFGYVLKANKAKRAYIPKFICEVMLEPLKKLGIEYSFYKIDENLEIAENIDLQEREFLLYVNYFGIKDSYSRKLSKKYKEQLILDCSQAFYFEPLEKGHTIYSPRKFFGISDGGMLYTGKSLEEKLRTDVSYDRFSHLIKRIDLGAEEAYEEFKNNDKSLNNQPIMHMSRLTKQILSTVDFKSNKKRRIDNFEFLHGKLAEKNLLKTDLNDYTCPMIYPFQTADVRLRKRLINNKVFVATYWPNVLEWCNGKDLEYHLTESILPLPIDQRYNELEMIRIVQLINES